MVASLLLLQSLSSLCACCATALKSGEPLSNTKFSPVLRLANGSPLRGLQTVSAHGELATEFLGVPFAEAPVGERRFAPPVPRSTWTTVLDAVNRPNSCPQSRDNYFEGFQGAEMWNTNTPLDEDCLYLNIWVPGHGSFKSNGPLLPVLVWIFGGGFWSGTSSLEIYDGKILSTEQNIIVVSMNYRVSVFGFLYLGRPEAPGNAGLLDQLEALKWVHRNIKVFGGDPEEVTLFGESAGAASVSLHMMSSLSQPYFKRAILQSGVATAPWATESQESMIERALLLSEACNCNVTIRDRHPDFTQLTRCLQQLPYEELLKHEWVTYEFLDFPWVPVVDHYFLSEEPRALLESGQFKRCDLLEGNNRDESIYFIIYYVDKIFKRDELMKFKSDFVTSPALFEQALYALLPQKYRKNPIVYKAILFEYMDYQLPHSARRFQDALDKAMGDYHFHCSMTELARKCTQHGANVYSYFFDHRATEQQWPPWMGVLHGYEINFIFGEPFDTQRFGYTEEERQLSKRFMTYWGNFARTGNPNINPDGTWTPELWPPFDEDEAYIVMTVGTNGNGTGRAIRRRQCAFWTNYLPKLYAATSSLTDVEVKWKLQMVKWEEEYIADWKHHFEMYKRLQKHRYMESACESY